MITSNIKCVNSSLDKNDGFHSSWISCTLDLSASSMKKKDNSIMQ